MTISEHVREFAGLPVVDFEPQSGILYPGTLVYRIGLTYDESESGTALADVLRSFADDPGANQISALVIGAWDYVNQANSSSIVETLGAVRDRLPNLKALFLGDIIMEEQEISWIEQSDVWPVLAAYPALEIFRVRGGSGLQFSELRHANLKSLIVEAGGLSAETVRQVASAHLPQLEHLELWLGDSGYGGDASVDDLGSILSGTQFPKLRYLGLRDSEIADEVAAAVAVAPVLSLIETLDLSMGTLSDKGAQALLDSPLVRKLKQLDLHHHYVSDEMVGKLMSLGIDISAGDKQEPDGDDRYVAVAE